MEGEEDSDGIRHRTVTVNGIRIHVAEKGEVGSTVVLFLHGFPELWYTWRHHVLALAARGFRAVAPDLRGYGDSDAPLDVESYSVLHLVADVVGLIQLLTHDKVFVVGHDWGAIIAWSLCLLRPDKVKAVVNLSVPFRFWDRDRKPVEFFKSHLGDDFYICRFQEPGGVEAEFSKISNELLLTRFFLSRDPRPLVLPKNPGFGSPARREIKLPPWLTQEDVAYYATKYKKSGYTGALNYYRAMDMSWELLAPWRDCEVKVHAKFIIGDQDLCFNFPGAREYMSNGEFQRDVPLLDEVVIMEGACHFLNMERAHEITEHIHEYIKQF